MMKLLDWFAMLRLFVVLEDTFLVAVASLPPDHRQESERHPMAVTFTTRRGNVCRHFNAAAYNRIMDALKSTGILDETMQPQHLSLWLPTAPLVPTSEPAAGE